MARDYLPAFCNLNQGKFTMKTWLIAPVLLGLILLPQSGHTESAAAEQLPSRLSLAISGGASMGAYEAGLIWGLVAVLRQVDSTRGWSLHGELRSTAVASIAGTSAGGINTILAALTWCVNPETEGGFVNRIDDNIFRDVWLTPDVNRLLPPTPDSPQYLPDDALLSRKDLVHVARNLRQKWDQPGTFRPGMRLPFGLTVTRVRPESMRVSGVEIKNQRFFIPFELRTRQDGSAEFGFHPDDYPLLNDPAMILMPWPAGRPPFSITDQQVEDALLTTSAFPVGFGRKHLPYCRQTDLSNGLSNNGQPVAKTEIINEGGLQCPDGYELAEAEFADGGLFDNLPIGLARQLAESSVRNKKDNLPVKYLYLDPDRERYESQAAEKMSACEGENPPDACREMTFNLAAETEVLGGAIGTARKYELYRELTSDNWRLNLPQISRDIADLIDRSQADMDCDALLPYFEGQPQCADRLRQTARLLELSHSCSRVPIIAPLTAKALSQSGIATACVSDKDTNNDTLGCTIDGVRLREHLARALVDLAATVAPEDETLIRNIKRSRLSIDSDRSIRVTSRGGPITGMLLGAFGAFIDYKFREFDYYVGIYDAITVATESQCARNYPSRDQADDIQTCRDRLSEQLYRLIGVADNPKSRYLFALMAKREFGPQGQLRYAYDPMPPEDRDIRIIYQGLEKSVLAYRQDRQGSEDLLPIEHEFFDYLKAEDFEPTSTGAGDASLLALIMDDPDYWSNELVNRATGRLVRLEELAERIYQAREPDPSKREKASPALMGAGALTLRTATYKFPRFTFSPSTAPQTWLWRNVIPYEASFDFADGDMLFLWQPTWNFNRLNAGIRFGVGFTGGVINSNADKRRENYGLIGLDLTQIETGSIFSGWGVTPAVYHNWKAPDVGYQTTFGVDVHAYLFKNRVRIGLGARDIVDAADDTIFFTVGFTDLPGLVYWLSR